MPIIIRSNLFPIQHQTMQTLPDSKNTVTQEIGGNQESLNEGFPKSAVCCIFMRIQMCTPIYLVIMWPAGKTHPRKNGISKSQTSYIEANDPHVSFRKTSWILIINEMIMNLKCQACSLLVFFQPSSWIRLGSLLGCLRLCKTQRWGEEKENKHRNQISGTTPPFS